MRFTAESGGRKVAVEVRAQSGQYAVSLGDRRLTLDAWRTGPGFLSLLLAGRSYHVGLEKTASGYAVRLAGQTVDVALSEGTGSAVLVRPASGSARVSAPMPGKIVRVLVEDGQVVEAGAALVVVEAMKMENELRATRGGRVRRVHVEAGQAVEGGALLVELE